MKISQIEMKKKKVKKNKVLKNWNEDEKENTWSAKIQNIGFIVVLNKELLQCRL